MVPELNIYSEHYMDNPQMFFDKCNMEQHYNVLVKLMGQNLNKEVHLAHSLNQVYFTENICIWLLPATFTIDLDVKPIYYYQMSQPIYIHKILLNQTQMYL
eukprot:347541_1